MNVLAYRLRPAAPWGTPWRADTLFGALCWQILRRRGEENLRKTLGYFREGNPPFLLSDACPGDWMPRPLVFLGGGKAQAEAWSGRLWVSHDDFLAARRGEIPAPSGPVPEPFQTRRTMHAGREGESFESQECTWAESWPAEQRYFTVYARVVPDWAEPLGQLFAAAGQFGLGRQRTLGRGAFTLEAAPAPADWLEPQRFEDGFIALNRFVPHETDPVKGRWTVHVKYPKYGDEFSSDGQACKGRIVQLGSGSCFQFPGRPKRWYGSMLANLPGHPEAVHYGLALAIGIRWPKF